MRLRTLFMTGTVVALAVGSSIPAAAQDARSGQPWHSGRDTSGPAGSAWLDFGAHTRTWGAPRTTSLSSVFGLGYQETDFAMELRVPVSFVRIAAANSVRAMVLGSIELSGMYVFDKGGVHLEIGGTLALPTSTEVDDGVESSSMVTAAAARGLWDAWLWLDDQLSLAAPLSVEYVTGRLGFGADFAFAVALPTGQPFGILQTVAPAGIVQFRPWAAYVHGPLRLGGMIQVVALLTDGRSRQQASIGPFVEYRAGRGFAGLRGLVNLDGPYGFAQNGNEIWGVHLCGGANF
jgi:hypothetical protein